MQLCCMGSPKKKGTNNKKSAAPKKAAPKKVVKKVSEKTANIAHKQYMAKVLYTREQLPQNAVAEKVGISTNTMSKWVSTFNWDALRKRLLISKEEQLNNLYEQLEALNNEIRNSDTRRPNTAQADVQVKITASIRNMETELAIADLVEAGIRFGKHLQGKCDHQEFMNFTEYWNDFIQSAIKK